MSKFNFENENKASLPSKFFVFIGRGREHEIDAIQKFVEKKTGVQVIYQARSSKYIRVCKEDQEATEK